MRSGTAGFVLKQGTNSETIYSVANEAEIYRVLAERNPAVPMPRLHSFTSGRLVVECVDGASLFERITQDRTVRAGRAADVASVLARLHRSEVGPEPVIPARPSPALLIADPPLSAFQYHTHGAHQLTRLIQSNEHLSAGLRQLYTRWSNSTLIHNDVRPENVIERPDTELVLIDWELAGMGDPRWDLSALVTEHLIDFLEDAETWTSPKDRRADVSAGKLGDLHRVGREILDRYRADGGPDVHPADLMQWIAGRLVLTTMERCATVAAVTAGCRHLLQVAANLFRRPEAGARIFLGAVPS
ncbi:hypothetical protein FRP1_30090 (plasmid) [Pseudonocardia sp. EC080625-04]|uniref:phosphotransferase family protein n=1 Tax=unclassified Pseudonocardia TaxID=2619320 RepID=UPI0006CB5C7E|nr:MULTISPECIES: phosphotransferase [unclassified Pseudonocardia]ALE76976.1 hypothetical protein FRP1_30090 [Pseudonocardia sp. EC080625-04]ALL85924.1 hypothetical protein AD017_33065 [Pseudonocardia sp. EC080619-01]